MIPIQKMKPNQSIEYLETAKSLAKKAAAEVIRLMDQPIATARKEDKTIVTEADLISDRILCTGLREAYPDHGIISEEDGVSGNVDSDYIWLIDPLDGTKAYAKGIAGFAIMVGLLKRGEPYLGVVVDPVEGYIYEAIRGQGAFITRQDRRERITVSKRNNYKEMPLVVSTGFPGSKLEILKSELCLPVVDPINSVGIKVGIVVRQEADIYLNHHSVCLWDTCAPQIILEEAGGAFTRLDGAPLEYKLEAPYSHKSLTLATNGTRHDDLVLLISDKKLLVS
jgi:3'(2'), 5'-bisphosphate nucleotidase